MQSNYHASIALDFFARVFAQERDGARGKYQTLLLLHRMWLYADPMAIDPVVYLTPARFATIAEGGRLRQLVSELKAVGAIEKVDRSIDGPGYRLVKPAIHELDSVAQAQLQGSVAAPAKVNEKKLSVLELASRRAGREIQRSDIRDMLADMAGISPNSLRYWGDRAHAVNAAIDALGFIGWDVFEQLIAAVKADPDKPPKCQYIFDRKHAAYRTKLLGETVSMGGSMQRADVDEASGSATIVVQSWSIDVDALTDYFERFTSHGIALPKGALERVAARELAARAAAQFIDAVNAHGRDRMQAAMQAWMTEPVEARQDFIAHLTEFYSA